MVVVSAFMCLTLNIYFEARGEPVQGQQAVALVTWNRAQRDPDNVCSVVFEPSQFSWTRGKVRKLKHGYKVSIDKSKFDREALDQAKRIASKTLAGRQKDFTKGATHFHAKRVRPQWKQGMRRRLAVGEHVFYAPPKS